MFLAVLAGLVVVACAQTTQSEPTATPTASAEVLPPVEVSGPKPVTVAVGGHLRVSTPGVTRVSVDNPTVLEVTQPHSDGSASFVAGATALSVGGAQLSVFKGDKKLYVTSVTVQTATAAGTPPAGN